MPNEEARRALQRLDPPRRRGRIYAALAAALLCALLLDLWMGEADVSASVTPSVVAQVLAHHLPVIGAHFPLPADVRSADPIVWEFRLPHIMGGVLVGMMLALAGVAFQSLLMNPLADPYTVGVASGSALGSMAVIWCCGIAWLGGWPQVLAAFLSGLAAVALVYLLARVGGRVSTQTFLLAGTIVGTFFWAMIPLMLTLSSRSGLDRQVFALLYGSLTFVGWPQTGLLLLFGLAGFILLLRAAPELDIMTQGEETAAHLGVDAEAFKRRVIVTGTLLTAAVVAVAGIIAFVGFVVPHAARRLVGAGHRGLLPAAMLLGGLMIVISDWLSRVFLHNVEIGVITSLFGVPFFCAMLRRQTARP